MAVSVVRKGFLALSALACLFPIAPLAQAASSTFINPVGPAGASSADPFVMRHTDGAYYYVFTSWDKLEITKASSLSGIGAGKRVTAWTPPAGPCYGINCNTQWIWAPELNFINGKWYLYFSAGDNNHVNHRIWVISNASADPTTGTWSAPVKVADANDKWAIDQTVMNINGQLYMAWSGMGGANDAAPQVIRIAKMGSPTSLIGAGTVVSTPTYGWETSGAPVNEGPQFLLHGGKVLMSFSASYCNTDDYKLGMLSANLGADLTLASNWTKSATPILEKGAGAFGPGHNSFVKSPDGAEDWVVYHANPATGQGCGLSRTTRIQKITWNGDTPVIGAPSVPGTPVARPAGEGNATILYRLRNEASGKVMSIDRLANPANGAAIWQWANLNNSDQLWTLDPAGSGFVQFTSSFNGNVADVYNFGTAPGVPVKSYPAIGASNQQWQLLPTTSQYFSVKNRHSGLMLDNKDGSTADGGVIQQWTGNGLAPQRWLLERAN
ncbi:MULTISPECIES: family 43 glycosylhydrolase [unclassified Janthinobacterium]|uniref:family 43 glycosylhydrolase n=1 Tax=unclassified Janthinobacterium TaxID=2610881 RepID=UPI00034D55C5|nr:MULTISPECIES: family 43 glycosylhydrolase [unclassified Janthinobacterium]MEC5159420.1 GH43 family beta-xylosidase [Janthinobacterium sp. CG_S6]